MIFLAILFGILIGIVHITLADLLVTALLATASSMLLGALRPERAWRWVAAITLPLIIITIAARLTTQPYMERSHIYAAVLTSLPALAGGYGGAIGRTLVRNLFHEPR